jgi:chromosomal replication initiator protein
MPFLVLSENRFAHTAVETLVSSAAQERHAPIYLYGPSGSGKTLLLKQAAALFRRSHRQAVASMVNAAEFSYPRGTSAELRQLESIDQSTGEVLVVFEDIQSLEGRSEAQRRLLAAGDELLGTGCRLIWTATKAPGELRGFLTRLRNRFRSGVLAGIKNPGRSSRGRLLEEFAATEKVPIGRDVVEFLARHSKNESPGELRAALHQVLALSRQRKSDVTVELARQSVHQDACLPEPGLPQITRQVAREFGIAVAALCSEKRQRDLLVPRQVAMYLARTLTSASVKRIGRHFGGRSHTTVLHACDRVAEMLRTQADLRHRLRQIQAGLGRSNNTDD